MMIMITARAALGAMLNVSILLVVIVIMVFVPGGSGRLVVVVLVGVVVLAPDHSGGGSCSQFRQWFQEISPSSEISKIVVDVISDTATRDDR